MATHNMFGSDICRDGLDLYLESESEADVFLKNIDFTIKGYKLVKNIITDDDDTVHYLVFNRHIGDAMKDLKNVVLFKNYYSVDDPYPYHFMNEAFPKNRRVKTVKVITNNSLSGVVRLFSSVDEIITVSQEELDYIDCYVRSSSCVHKNLYRDEYSEINDKAAEANKVKMFGVSSHKWELDLPPKLHSQADWILSAIKIKHESIQMAKKILTNYNIGGRDMVVVCPYAQSTSMIPESYWIKIVQKLKNDGFTVFTNVGPKERELPETLRLEAAVDTICGLGILGCSIIGIQSGLMDTFRWVNADIRIIVISYLVDVYDVMVAENRRLEKRIEQRGNITHILIHKGEEGSLYDAVISSFSYVKKGYYQHELFKTSQKKGFPLFSCQNLNEYICEFLKMKDCILFLSVYDSANKYAFDASKVGLQLALSLKRRQSYIAVVNSDGTIEYEQKQDNCRVISYQFMFKDCLKENIEKDVPTDNFAYILSHALGVGRYTKSVIIINGEEYSLSRRGLNIAVYNKQLGRVIDSIVVDTWADPDLIVIREND